MTTQEQVKDVVSQVLADKADKGGIKRVVWIAPADLTAVTILHSTLWSTRPRRS